MIKRFINLILWFVEVEKAVKHSPILIRNTNLKLGNVSHDRFINELITLKVILIFCVVFGIFPSYLSSIFEVYSMTNWRLIQLVITLLFQGIELFYVGYVANHNILCRFSKHIKYLIMCQRNPENKVWHLICFQLQMRVSLQINFSHDKSSCLIQIPQNYMNLTKSS